MCNDVAWNCTLHRKPYNVSSDVEYSKIVYNTCCDVDCYLLNLNGRVIQFGMLFPIDSIHRVVIIGHCKITKIHVKRAPDLFEKSILMEEIMGSSIKVRLSLFYFTLFIIDCKLSEIPMISVRKIPSRWIFIYILHAVKSPKLLRYKNPVER